MRTVTVRRGPRPCPHGRLLVVPVLTLAALLLATNAFAQDRVILFDSGRLASDNSFLPAEIRDFEITQGGRAWSLVRLVTLPGHQGLSPVALTDGSRVLWLARTSMSTVLVQYETGTARAAVVNIGTFDQSAFMIADRLALRVAIIEPTRVTFV